MLPIVCDEARMLLASSGDSRPPPFEFSRFFTALAVVASKLDTWTAPELREFAMALPSAQVFDFGEIPEPFLTEEAKLGGGLMGEGLLKSPYRTAIYWYTLTDTVAYQKSEMPEDRIRYVSLVHRRENDHYLISDFMVATPDMAQGLRNMVINSSRSKEEMRELMRGKHLFMCMGIGRLEASKNGRWGGVLLDSPGREMTQEKMVLLLGSLADGVAALSMILSTKGVGLRREAAPHKLNVKRERSGKPAYPVVTYVNVGELRQAMERTSRGGTHASPVPHFRRGHVRTYESGKKVWIDSMLINCRNPEEAVRRDHYEVKR
jgi:hypothetical protein